MMVTKATERYLPYVITQCLLLVSQRG